MCADKKEAPTFRHLAQAVKVCATPCGVESLEGVPPGFRTIAVAGRAEALFEGGVRWAPLAGIEEHVEEGKILRLDGRKGRCTALSAEDRNTVSNKSEAGDIESMFFQAESTAVKALISVRRVSAPAEQAPPSSRPLPTCCYHEATPR